ncbi:MAG: hypothetical protein M3441_10270 [Chloroflexota bacterium]|nr:hypothetical protein [Chloroflexota bacterium]
MARFTLACGIIWRMVVHGIVLGLAAGAILGPISMVIMYIAELFSGRYSLSNFPFATATVYCMLAIIAGAIFGGIFGFVGGIVSGVSLALGLLLSTGHLMGPKLYRNMLAALGTAGVSLIVLLPFSLAILGDDWFFNGNGVVVPLIALALLPTIASAISTWWASMEVLRWWETATYTFRWTR